MVCGLLVAEFDVEGQGSRTPNIGPENFRYSKYTVFVCNKLYSLNKILVPYLILGISIDKTILKWVQIRKIGIFRYFCLIFGVLDIF